MLNFNTILQFAFIFPLSLRPSYLQGMQRLRFLTLCQKIIVSTRKRDCLKVMSQIDIFSLHLNNTFFFFFTLINFISKERGLKCSVISKIFFYKSYSTHKKENRSINAVSFVLELHVIFEVVIFKKTWGFQNKGSFC